jgi:predicted DNA-binding protein (MmcQ/YjbR family)
MFCYFNVDRFDACTIKCDPERIAELTERYHGIDPPYNGSAKYWIGVRFNDDVSDEQIRALVRRSYELVVAGLPERLKP